ncbi:MAG TPA: pyridoxal-phosphate dependent enzyme [Gemmatimonadales bacterium]|nr:pyridoxal-phosphate dependent enzyme [Gemmatimonadales bacterium]
MGAILNSTPGPTYAEMRSPALLPPAIRQAALAKAKGDALHPLNLFNITWRNSENRVRHVVLPRELTGVAANIVVLLGRDFPSGSHKVGPAYATLMEGELAGEIRPGENTVIGPSTGNFGIGTAYISKLMGYRCIVVMPEQMSAERYERIRRYGGELDLTPGSESDVILVLERVHDHFMQNPDNKVLAQFELLPNYRFHRCVTGDAALEAARGSGNGRVAAFVSAPGSAGTLGAGDEIKARFADCVVVAVEPKECSTLFNNGRGTHRIEGIGDKMVPLIHNVLTTDYVMMVHDDDCVAGLKVLQDGPQVLERLLKLTPGSLAWLRDWFGISSVCNILGAIKTAKLLDLGPNENIVTVATDGFDRYPSVMADLEKRRGPTNDVVLATWFDQIFRGATRSDTLDVRSAEQKDRLFRMKHSTWTRFGYSESYLEQMKSQTFWDAEYGRIEPTDRALLAARKL